MRLIDADRLKAEIMGWHVVLDDLFDMGKYHERELVLQAIEKSPTINAVPVVRCKECTYRQKAKVNRKGFLICPASGMEITDDDYCSYGAKMESEVKHDG